MTMQMPKFFYLQQTNDIKKQVNQYKYITCTFSDYIIYQRKQKTHMILYNYLFI